MTGYIIKPLGSSARWEVDRLDEAHEIAANQSLLLPDRINLSVIMGDGQPLLVSSYQHGREVYSRAEHLH